jgi:hypothetical protein
VGTVTRAGPIAVSDPNVDVEWLEVEFGRSASIVVITAASMLLMNSR